MGFHFFVLLLLFFLLPLGEIKMYIIIIIIIDGRCIEPAVYMYMVCDVYVCSVYRDLSRHELYMLEAAGLFSASVGIWIHHVPYVTFTAGMIAVLASQSQHVVSVIYTLHSSVCLSVCLSVSH